MAKTFSELLTAYAPVLALFLQALVLSRFLEARNRNYPLAILYSLLLFLLTSTAILWQYQVAWVLKVIPPSTAMVNVLSALEVFMHVLLLVLMLQLLQQTFDELGIRKNRIAILAAISVLIFFGTLFWVAGVKQNAQFLRVRQTVGFWMVLLNLYWWTLLLRVKGVGRRILLLSTGIGLQMTGQVISDGILGLVTKQSQTVLPAVGYTIMFLTHFLSLGVWYQAFHPKNAKEKGPSLGMALPKTPSNGEAR